MKRGRITLRGPVFPHTGYGQHLAEACRWLEMFGHEVNVLPTGSDESHGARSNWQLQKNFVRRPQSEDWEILIHPPDMQPSRSKKTLLWTMWEATNLPERIRMCVNQADALVVPDQWNAAVFSAAGYDGPIHIVPLGIGENFTRYQPMQMGGATVFGAAGRMAHGGARKGLQESVEAFREAFPDDEDVRLKVKAHDDCDVRDPGDSRIEITRKWLSEHELANWMARLTSFVSCSKGEGWGLFQHQAMGVGRPVVGAPWAGLNNLIDSDTGFPVDYDLIPAGSSGIPTQGKVADCYLYGSAESIYRGCGHWAEPRQESVVNAMRRIHSDRRLAENKGVRAHKKAAKMTWAMSMQRFYKTLQTLGIA